MEEKKEKTTLLDWILAIGIFFFLVILVNENKIKKGD